MKLPDKQAFVSFDLVTMKLKDRTFPMSSSRKKHVSWLTSRMRVPVRRYAGMISRTASSRTWPNARSTPKTRRIKEATGDMIWSYTWSVVLWNDRCDEGQSECEMKVAWETQVSQ